MITRPLALSALLFTVPSLLFADLPSPQLHRITPIGINAPGEVEVSILGADLEGADALLFDHPGLKAAFVKDKAFKLTVAADVPAGTYDVRAVGRFGVTNPRLLSITHGLQDVTEVEPNNAADKAQSITINSSVAGPEPPTQEAQIALWPVASHSPSTAAKEDGPGTRAK